MQIEAKRSTPSQKIMSAYCKRLGMRPELMRFVVDGLRCGVGDTAAGCGLAEGAVLEAKSFSGHAAVEEEERGWVEHTNRRREELFLDLLGVPQGRLLEAAFAEWAEHIGWEAGRSASSEEATDAEDANDSDFDDGAHFSFHDYEPWDVDVF